MITNKKHVELKPLIFDILLDIIATIENNEESGHGAE